MIKEDRSKSLKILNSLEKREYYGLPRFTPEERDYFFSLDDTQSNYLEKMRGVNSKLCFILRLGYFKAKGRIFDLRSENSFLKQDISYLGAKYFPKKVKLTLAFNKNTFIKQKEIILKLFSYRTASQCYKEINEKAKSVISIDANPKYIFVEIIRFAHFHRIIVPAYRKMQQIISNAILAEENRLFNVLNQCIDKELETQLENLLAKEENGRYLFVMIRTPAKGFSYKKVSQEIKKLKNLKDIYLKTNAILDKLSISNHTVKYFARLADSFSVNRLKRFEKIKQYFYILCFIRYRYLKINDDLMKTFLYLVGKYTNEIKSSVNERLLLSKKENNRNIPKGSKLLELFTKDEWDNSPFIEVKSEAYKILDCDKIKKLANYLAKIRLEKKEVLWEEYDKKYQVIKKNIRHLIAILDFNSDKTSGNQFLECISYLKNYIATKKKNIESAPLSPIPKKELKYLCRKDKSKELIFERYEIFLYRRLRHLSNSGDVFIKDSTEYRSMEEDLVSEEYLDNHYNELVQSFNLPYFSDNFCQRVEEKISVMENTIEKVNKNILSKKNQHFDYKVNQKTGLAKWKLSYRGIENKEINNPVFKKLEQIELLDLLLFVQEKVDFLDAFAHIIQTQTKKERNDIELYGCIIGYGENHGLRKMAECSNISYDKLKQSSINYLREETIKLANEKIIKATAKLPIFEYYNISEHYIHSSSDGQKFYLSVEAMNARHSPKYFGLEKGIAVLTLNANNLPLVGEVNSANEYEGHHLLELLLMNESDVKPSVHSTDSHGSTEINFALLELFGYSFAPRYSNLNNRSKQIFGIKNPKDYDSDYILKPVGKINKELIFEEEKNIKRIIASLKLKKATVSTIVKKITNSPASNKTRKALVELDKIFRTTYILRYIDDLTVRQNVQVALNRGEAYHFLKKAVMYVNGGRIKASTETEQMIYQECARLICNVIIYYNSYILSQLLIHRKEMGDDKGIEALRRISPIAWQHIGLYGKYDFTKKLDISIGSKIAELIKNLTY